MPGYGPVFTTTAANCSYWPSCRIGTTDGKYDDGTDDTFSYEKMALNAQYAVGETDRMLHEIGMETAGEASAFQASVRMLERRYFMTYVPLLVFGSLLCCLCACLITFGLLVYHWQKRTYSFKRWRKLTVTHPLVDVADGPRGDVDFFLCRHKPILRCVSGVRITMSVL